jgi:hypothetical protein
MSCVSNPQSSNFISATIRTLPTSGIYSALPCDSTIATGVLETRAGQGRSRETAFCLDDDIYSEQDRIGFVHIDGTGNSRFCFSMVGYAETRADGISEVGKRAADCHNINLEKP